MTRVVMWISLLMLVSTTAYGLQLTAAAMTLPTAASADAPPAGLTHGVTVVAVDPITHERTQVDCDASSSTFASDVVLVNAVDFPAVVRGCSGADAPATWVRDW